MKYKHVVIAQPGGPDVLHFDWYREDVITLLDLLATGKIKPVIAACLPLVEATQAHKLLDHAAVNGKLVLICDSSTTSV
ncbi:zinc-binding dehydrogenase [Leptolyngbya sp. NK1-12]|uniref:Zinc-binding dehydrogenase n=1 Tax=Leptolyngbya sp. NK1-12 TaxID=2547451 RepID=A0AA96WM44_9CYAN|nr:zinc-binding dehydrogenase [Leptolyngbya sp. NK1-12]